MAASVSPENKSKFRRYAVIFCILGVVWMFLYSGLQNDQINIIQASSAWSATDTQMPITVGNIVCIALTVVYGTLFMKFGAKKTLIPCIAVCALGCIGISVANGVQVETASGVMTMQSATTAGITDYTIKGSYGLYWVSLFLIRCACMCFQMAGFQMAASWFIRFRGRVLGIITLGSPLFSLIGTSAMTTYISTSLGGDYRPFYVGICVLLVVVAVLTALLLKDYPEQAGLYPDGAAEPPKSEANAEEVHLTAKQVLSQKKSWMLIVNFGAFQFVINCCMASMVVWFMYLCQSNWDLVAATAAERGMDGLFAGTGPMFLFVGYAVRWLSVGVLIGIAMSFVFGVIDDKFGTPIATLLLGITEFFPVIGLMAQANAVATTGAPSVPMLILWGFGVACMTGGVPTMHPASMSFTFGRREYQSANRIIMAIQLIPSAVAATIMMSLIQSGHGTAAWIMVLVVVVIGIVATIPMFKMQDANAADRDSGKK